LGLTDYLNLGRYNLLGLDIGRASVKIAQLKKADGRFYVGKCAKVNIADRETENADCIRENTIDAIRTCIDIVGAKTSYAVCAVNGPDITVRSFNLPAMPEEQIAWAVLQEAEQVCPLDMQQSIVDYQLIEQPNGRQATSGLLVAAGIESVCEKKQWATDAGLQNVLMDVNSLALLNCFTAFGGDCQGQATAVLDIGSCTTNLLILSNRAMPFVRSISHGGWEAIQFISNEQGIPTTMVEKVLCRQIPNISRTEPFRNCFHSGCETLVKEIGETFRYYKTHEDDCDINKVCICGGFAGAAGIEQLLSEKLVKQVDLWNPLQGASFQANVIDTQDTVNDGPSMAVALGLAMRSA